MTLWSGRFSSGMGDGLWDLSESYSFDHVLFPFDVLGSKAHVEGLVSVGLLSAEEGTTLFGALDAVMTEFEDDRFERSASDEDVHMAIERRVIELAGESNNFGDECLAPDRKRRAVATIKWPRPFDSSRWMPCFGSSRSASNLSTSSSH